MPKLDYKIADQPRQIEGAASMDTEAWDVEWTRDDGQGFTDHVLLPMHHPAMHSLIPAQEYKRFDLPEKIMVVKDQINVPKGSSRDFVEAECIKKRLGLAQKLGLAS